MASNVEERVPLVNSSGSGGPSPSSASSNQRLTTHGLALVFTTALGGFLFGYDTGVISGALFYLRKSKVLQVLDGDQKRLDFVEGAIVSGTTFGAALGAALGGYFADKLGRKKSIVLADFLFIVGSCLLALSSSYVELIVGRVIVGLGVGVASMVVPLFIAEVSPKNLRAALVTVNVLFITTGQFLSYLVNYFLSYIQEDCWRYMLGVAALPAMLQLVGIVMLPESPRWLVFTFQVERAREALKLLFKDNTEAALKEIMSDVAAASNQTSNQEGGLNRTFARSLFRAQLKIGCGLQILQQLSGINTIMYLCPIIMSSAGFVGREALLISMLPAFTNASSTLFGIWAIERHGRRKLLLSSLAVVSLSLFLLGMLQNAASHKTPPVYSGEDAYNTCPAPAADCNACIQHQCVFCGLKSYHQNYNIVGRCIDSDAQAMANCTSLPDPVNPGIRGPRLNYQFGCPSPYTGWIVALVMFYLVGFAPGLSPVPWAMNSELYSPRNRGLGNGYAAVSNWISNSIVTLFFIPLQHLLPPGGVFFLCQAVTVVGFVWVYLVLPETKGLTFEEIQLLFIQRLKPKPLKL